ncbi:hypothetical protein [Halovivax gelatinilyticus]|uniref:hypothetical protein n=1 Tax=Halovivax gelatinilyticus TaxID=2961597 RepID=UPI0020CA4B75|nr:hypothetical protein [Halovivax gelatinilyticus]
MRNLREGLIERGVQPSQVAEYETLQSVSRSLLDQRYNGDPRILNQRVAERLLRSVVEDAQAEDAPTALRALIGSIGDTWDDELYETLGTELDRYWRATDAGNDHERLAEATARLDDPFACHRNKRALAGLAALTAVLRDRTDPLPPEVFLSESHLTRAARDVLQEEWNRHFGDVEWVAVGTIKSVDNTMLRFFRELDDLEDGPELRFFFGVGSRERLADRFRRTGIDVRIASLESSNTSFFAENLVEAAVEGSRPDGIPDEVRFLDAPDRRREVERVARDIASNVREGSVTPGEHLVIPRETREYEAIIDDVFTTYGLPYHIESDRPLAQVVAYRFLKATVDLIAAAAKGDAVSYHDVVDPLRLGFCPLEDAPGDWPLDDASFLLLEERLHAITTGARLERRTVDEWRKSALEREGESEVWRQVVYFLSWALERAESAPVKGEEVTTLLDGLCQQHVVHVADAPVRRSGGPGVDTTRTDVIRKHPSHLAERVADELAGVGSYYDYLRDLDLAEPGWDLAAQALGDVVGRSQYATSNADGNAVRVVIPANTYFLSAKRAYLLGVGAGEFPAQHPTPTFLHDALSQTVQQYASEGPTDASPLYLPGGEAMYRRELDDYEAAVRTATEGITISRHARDSSGDRVSWSPFVASLTDVLDEADRGYERVRQSHWLPSETHHRDRADVTDTGPMRDRLRLLSYHCERDSTGAVFRPSDGAIESETDAIRLLSNADGPVYRSQIAPRRERFRHPKTTVTVSADEPAFEGDLSLADVVGAPIRPHEVDLMGQCDLKYYFYQFLVARDGPELNRDDWPEEESPYARELYPTVPAVVGNHYVPPSYRRAVEQLVTTHLPNRQADLGAYDDVAALRSDFEMWLGEDDELDESVFQALVGEYLTVTQELESGIDRSWSWRGEQRVEVGDHKLVIPPHRVDTISDIDDPVPVFQSGRQGGARAALKHCWTGTLRPERAERVCWSCERLDQCSIPTKHSIDTRARASAIDEAGGAFLLDRYASGPNGRQGFLLGDDIELVPHEQYVRTNGSTIFEKRTDMWREELEELLDSMTPENETVTYAVSEEFVNNGGCEGCSFRDLCGVPTRDGADESGGEDW